MKVPIVGPTTRRHVRLPGDRRFLRTTDGGAKRLRNGGDRETAVAKVDENRARNSGENRGPEAIVERMKRLHDGDAIVIEVVAQGAAALPALRRLLFEPEPSGIFEPRCRAVEALAALEARNVLIEFLSHPREIDDPVTRLGEEAVISAAARTLKGGGAKEFDVLLAASRRGLLPGVIEALGSFRRPEAQQILIEALAEDASRPAAEAALRDFGDNAIAALLNTARRSLPSAQDESESSLRRRRSALKLLSELGSRVAPKSRVWILTWDADPWIAFYACKICSHIGDQLGRREAIDRMCRLLGEGDWLLSCEIEDFLVSRFDIARTVIERKLTLYGSAAATDNRAAAVRDTLSRVKRRALGKPRDNASSEHDRIEKG